MGNQSGLGNQNNQPIPGTSNPVQSSNPGQNNNLANKKFCSDEKTSLTQIK